MELYTPENMVTLKPRHQQPGALKLCQENHKRNKDVHFKGREAGCAWANPSLTLMYSFQTKPQEQAIKNLDIPQLETRRKPWERNKFRGPEP